MKRSLKADNSCVVRFGIRVVFGQTAPKGRRTVTQPSRVGIKGEGCSTKQRSLTRRGGVLLIRWVAKLMGEHWKNTDIPHKSWCVIFFSFFFNVPSLRFAFAGSGKHVFSFELRSYVKCCVGWRHLASSEVCDGGDNEGRRRNIQASVFPLQTCTCQVNVCSLPYCLDYNSLRTTSWISQNMHHVKEKNLH